jgi:hypothetical protein
LGFREGTYETETRAAYSYEEFPPFFALKAPHRVVAFDVPQVRLADTINGFQVQAWGAHSPQVPSGSIPDYLFQEIVDSHGVHPGLHKDYAVCLDLKGTLRLEERFKTGIARRSAICQDLMTRDSWDLFLTVFSELHAGGHVFWHLSQPEHPLYEAFKDQVAHDPLLEIFQAIDQAIGEIVASAPADARVIIFSAHGMGPATIDLPSFVFLPELLYRFSFPGKWALGTGERTASLPPMVTKMQWNFWERHIWGTQYDPNPVTRFLRRKTPTRLFRLIERWIDSNPASGLISPLQLMRQGDRVVPWNPAQWYKPLWPTMKAFAIPSFAEGYIRINLKGREPQGIVTPANYHAVCDELCHKLYNLKDSRKGIPMVSRVVRTRENPLDRNPKLPDADLIVVWQDDFATDVVESPEYGQIGPFPPYRAGSHRSEGLILATGPDIPASTHLVDGHVLDLAPTILQLAGAAIPSHLEGKPLPIVCSTLGAPEQSRS